MDSKLSVFLVLVLVALQRRATPLPRRPLPSSGVAVVRPTNAEDLDLLGPVWYYRYDFAGETLKGHERLYMVRPGYSESEVRRALRRRGESWWIVGNEPNDPYQDNLSPGAYAAFYRRFEIMVRKVAPTCRIATAGISNADWRWAQAFREAYRAQYGTYPRVDAWNVHNYVLEPHEDQLDVDEFESRLVAFRTWMMEAGEGNRPLLLTEFGALFGTGHFGRPSEDPVRIVEYIHRTVEWLDSTDYVQCWAWFANGTSGQFNGDLYDEAGQLTVFGRAYREAVRKTLEGGGKR